MLGAKLDSSLSGTGVNRTGLHASLIGAEGKQRVIITLAAESGARAFERGADTFKAKGSAKSQQEAFINMIRQVDPSAEVIARVQLVMNAVFVSVDASVLPALAEDARVLRIAPVGDYQIALEETVPYIGAAAVQAAGYDGSGIKVAVLDSGIDYLHAAGRADGGCRRQRRRQALRQRLARFGPTALSVAQTEVPSAVLPMMEVVALSPNLPEGGKGELSPTPDIRAFGVNTFIVPPGVCSDQNSFIWAFAINTWERQQHLVPVNHNVYLDINQDGAYDYAVYNFDASLSGSISDGRQLTWAENLETGDATAFFFTEHATNTANTVLYECGEQVGLTIDDVLATNVGVAVEAYDWYNGGPGDVIEGLTLTPLGEQFYAETHDVAAKSRDAAGLTVYTADPVPGTTKELGLLVFTNGDRGAGARGGATATTEAITILAKGR